MLPFDVMLLFFTSSVLLAMAPGPDNLFVLAQSAQHGKKAGIVVTIGLCTGVLVHIAAVSMGVAAVFQTSQLAFNILKYIGAAYLIYLAVMSFRASGAAGGPGKVEKLQYRRLYGRGMIMNVTNPKVTLFFLAFLPQFANPAYGPIVPQIVMLGAIFILSTILIFGAVALLAGTFGEWLAKSERASKLLNRTAGSIFGVLAVKLILSER